MKFVAVDLGASSGRLMVGRWDGRRFSLEELHRFANGGVSVQGSIDWDVLRIWSEIQSGLMKYRARFGDSPAGIGVDAWGVDFGLLDKRGRLLGNPSCYRDPRTNGVPEKVFARVSEAEIFAATGVQTMQINTLFQLASMAMAGDPKLECAETLLMIPDLFNYFLCGERAVEYTEASTTQMYKLGARDWDREMLRRVGIPERILTRVVQPGTVLADVSRDVLEMCGFAKTFPVIAVGSHDTASAVASIPNLDEGSAFISSGTWSLMGVELDAPVINERTLGLNYTNEIGAAGKVRFLKNIAGLWLVQECRKAWALEGSEYGYNELTVMAAGAEPFAAVIDPDAFLEPGAMPERIATLCRETGQSAPETPGSIVRTCLESLALRYRQVLESLESVTGSRIETIYIVGGGSKNALLNRFVAEATGRTVVAGPAEATAVGNLLVQALGAGEIEGLEGLRAVVRNSFELERIEAPGAAPEWDRAYEKYLKIVSARA